MLTATGLKRSELGTDGRKLVRHKGKQVLVIAQQDRVFAIANRCPVHLTLTTQMHVTTKLA